MTNRIEQALSKANKLNEKDAGKAKKVISDLQKDIEETTEKIKKLQAKRDETLSKLGGVHAYLLSKKKEGFEIEALRDLAA